MYRHLFIFTIFLILETACSHADNRAKSIPQEVSDTVSHGYNELANPDSLKTFSISDYNTDNPEVENINRPSTSILKTNLDTSLLFGIWTSDPNGPHADFWLTSASFFVVDYDGDGSMPYKLTNDSIKIYYNDFVQSGHIISISKDSLKIIWSDYEATTKYVRWTK